MDLVYHDRFQPNAVEEGLPTEEDLHQSDFDTLNNGILLRDPLQHLHGKVSPGVKLIHRIMYH